MLNREFVSSEKDSIRQLRINIRDLGLERFKNRPLVSVLMLTYKHDQFICQAITSVLDQKCDFEFELIVADDSSPDNTEAIVASVIQSHPKGHCVKYNRHKRNIGMQRNADFVLKAAKGKYVAICEGDDYWSDVLKLQMQVNFLERNSEYGLVHHEADYLYHQENKLIQNYHRSKKIIVSSGLVFNELLKHNNIFTLTVVFRRDLIERYFSINENVRYSFLMSDYVMWLQFSQHCQFHYIDKSMAVYRVLPYSASNSDSMTKKIFFLKSYCRIKDYFINEYKHESFTSSGVTQYYLMQASIYSIKYSKFTYAWIFARRLRLDSQRNIALFLLCGLFYYLKPLRILNRFF